MKWLIIQSDGMHKGQDGWERNDYLRECHSLQYALQINHEQADVWGLRHDNFASVPDFEAYDVVLLVENYEFDWLPDFSRMTKPLRIQWVIDLHCQHWERYARFSEHMDIVLHSTKSLIPGYAHCVPRARHLWFPNAIDGRHFTLDFLGAMELNFDRKTDIIFIGGKGPARGQTIDRMVAEAGMTYQYGITGARYIAALASSKIGFNKNQAGDLNYRTFEVLGCGACLLTERDPVLEELNFVDGQNCVLYGDDGEAVRKGQELLASGQWQQIAREGYQLSKRHTYVQRIKQLLGQL
jgi:hypothetical protein